MHPGRHRPATTLKAQYLWVCTDEQDGFRAGLHRRVDGLVLTPVTKSQGYLPEHSRDLRMVFVDREPAGIDASSNKR